MDNDTLELPSMDVLGLLFRSIVYLSWYPFSLRLPYPTFEGLKRALVLLLPDPQEKERGRIDLLIGTHNTGRARTKWDRRRLLFQSFAIHLPGNGLPFDEQEWREKAAQRAADYSYPSDDFTVTNRDNDGDEIFHDYVDFMEATQLLPTIGPRARITRDPFRSLARMLYRKDHQPKLADLVITRHDLCRIVQMMIRLHLDSSGHYFREHPDEIENCVQPVAASFLQGNDLVNWDMFASSFGRTTPWLFKPLFCLLSCSIHDSPTEHKKELPPMQGEILTVPRLAQLSLFLHDDYDFESFRLVSTDVGKLTEQMSSSIAMQYPGLLLFSAKSSGQSDAHVYGFWSEHPARDKECIQEPGCPDYQPSSLFQLQPVHDVFPGQLGALAWSEKGGTIVFGDRNQGTSIEFSSESTYTLVVRHVLDSGSQDDGFVFAATDWRGTWELELGLNCIEYWQYIVD